MRLRPLDLLGDDLAWVTREARCHDTPDHWWFPKQGPHTASETVRNLCNSCPLIEPCLDYALRSHANGIWAGTTEDQRKQLRRRGAA